MIPKRDPIPEFIKFVKGWVGDIRNEHRIPKSQLPKWIPPALREFYHQFGNYPAAKGRKRESHIWMPLFSAEHMFYAPPKSDRSCEANRFAFWHENQGVVLAFTTPNQISPPVWIQDDPDGPFRLVDRRLGAFVVTLALQEIVFGARYLVNFDADAHVPQKIFRGRRRRLWENSIRFDENSSNYSHTFWIIDDKCIVFDQHGELWLAAKEPGWQEVLHQGVKTIDINENSPRPAYPVSQYGESPTHSSDIGPLRT